MRILLISSEAYRIFLADSVLEDKVRLAAEAFNSESLATKSDIARLETGITRLDGELAIVKWPLGLVVGGVTSLAVNQLSLVNLFDEWCVLKLQPLRQLLS